MDRIFLGQKEKDFILLSFTYVRDRNISMTCILGLVKDGEVYIGGDSMASNGWDMRLTARPKVFRKSGLIIGYTTSFRMGQILEHNLIIPEITKDYPMEYMVESLIPEIRKTLKELGFSKVENNVETGGDFLVGFGGNLFAVYSDYQVLMSLTGYESVGIGAPFAMGALSAFLHDNLIQDPKALIVNSIVISSKLCNGVCGPYYVLKG